MGRPEKGDHGLEGLALWQLEAVLQAMLIIGKAFGPAVRATGTSRTSRTSGTSKVRGPGQGAGGRVLFGCLLLRDGFVLDFVFGAFGVCPAGGNRNAGAWGNDTCGGKGTMRAGNYGRWEN